MQKADVAALSKIKFGRSKDLAKTLSSILRGHMPTPLQIPFTIFTDDGPMDGVAVTVYGNFTASKVRGEPDVFNITSIQGRDRTYYPEAEVLDEGERMELLELAQLDYVEATGHEIQMDYDDYEGEESEEVEDAYEESDDYDPDWPS